MYWYHLSTSWIGKTLTIHPRQGRRDNHEERELKAAICVAPSITRCLVALGSWRDYPTLQCYRTIGDPIPAHWVFDYYITCEHRFYETKIFEYVNTLEVQELCLTIPERITSGISDKEILELLELDYNNIISLLPEHLK